jgi:hypothetical protein
VATIARNHALRSQRNGICPDPLDWSKQNDSAPFYFDLQQDFAEIMHHIATREHLLVVLGPVDALELSPTVVLDVYQGVGDSFLGRHEGRQAPHAVHHRPIQVAAIGDVALVS